MPPRPDSRAITVFQLPYLVVTRDSASHMLAMKVGSGREKDFEEIETLLRALKPDDMDGIRKTHRAAFPHENIPARSEKRVAALLRSLQSSDWRYEPVVSASCYPPGPSSLLYAWIAGAPPKWTNRTFEPLGK